MADPSQLALLRRRSVEEWNTWRNAHPNVIIDLREANLCQPVLGLDRAMEAVLRGAKEATLRGANLIPTRLTVDTTLRGANLTGADLTRANLRGADLTGAKRDTSPPKDTTSEAHQNQSSSATDWLSLIKTVGNNLLLTTAALASIIQGLDVIERRWREHQAKRQQQGAQMTSPSSSKIPISDSEIIEILLVMDDGSHHTFKRWISDPDTLRAHIDAFSDPTSKVKPLQVIFKKHKGRALAVDVTTGGKDNKQLNAILSYLEADPQP